ncbi:MAG: NusG domain II-containing protein [Clostridia bacterium]|nr:NusG domain II-containing protein [Clostridia bacterium]MDE7214419.1 NusG domain II-containing protein [Clostridia bacterium]
MSLKKVTQVKADKGFKIWDLIIYGAVALIIAVIFTAVFVTRDASPLKGVKIYTDEVLVFEYNFTDGEYKNYSPQTVVIIEKPLAVQSVGSHVILHDPSVIQSKDPVVILHDPPVILRLAEESPAENSLKIKVTANGGYNVIEIDKAERSVKVTEADCGKRDCVYTAAITDNSGMIYCSPHKLRILPYDFDSGDNIII